MLQRDFHQGSMLLRASRIYRAVKSMLQRNDTWSSHMNVICGIQWPHHVISVPLQICGDSRWHCAPASCRITWIFMFTPNESIFMFPSVRRGAGRVRAAGKMTTCWLLFDKSFQSRLFPCRVQNMVQVFRYRFVDGACFKALHYINLTLCSPCMIYGM
jgi:hypothetical protein